MISVVTAGETIGEATHLSIHFTKTELASMIRATRETVNCMLQQLAHKEAIDNQNGEIIIMDLAYLCSLCKCEHCPVEICRL